MEQHFVNRKEELNFLERKYREKTPQLLIIYGRRRVGKTTLLKEFAKNKKNIYILCTKDSIADNLKSFKQKFADFTGKEYFAKLEVSSFFELFQFFAKEIKKSRTIVIIDEFPYLIELNRGIVSVFQKIWDEILQNTKIMLILCGSSIGMMENQVLGYNSPLYGRRTGSWKLKPLKFKHIKEFFPNYRIEDLIKVYAVVGGIPLYLTLLDPHLTVEQNIKEKILRKGEVLYDEPLILLREEFREPRVYTLILKYLSLGYNTYGKLCSATGMDKSNLSEYLESLEEIYLVSHILPLGKRKGGIYLITDNFFNFWFKFVYPNRSELEFGRVEEVFSRIARRFNEYLGHMFEKLILELLSEKSLKISIEPTWIGKWWHKDKEIDLVALNEKTKEILFGECKWKSRVNAKKICKELAEKAQYVKWYNDKRKESFAVFAKSFSKRIDEFEGKPVYCFDLKDLEKTIKI